VCAHASLRSSFPVLTACSLNQQLSSDKTTKLLSSSCARISFPAVQEYQYVCGDDYSVPIHRLTWPCSGCASSYRFEGEWTPVYSYAKVHVLWVSERTRYWSVQGFDPTGAYGTMWSSMVLHGSCDQLELPSPGIYYVSCSEAQHSRQHPRGH
jgi:hypothetical protein